MSKEIKTVSEINAMILAHLRNIPTGENVESVGIIFPPSRGGEIAAHVQSNYNGENVAEMVAQAQLCAIKLCREYDVREE